MSKEEHELARKVVDKYGDTLKMLAKVLKEIKGVSDLDDELSPNPLRILIPGERPIEGGTVPELFTNILKWLQDTDRLDKLEIPLASGKALYILSEEAKHPNGKPFNKSRLCFRSNGRDLYMNTNYSHNGGLRVGVKLLQHAGITNAKALSLDEEE